MSKVENLKGIRESLFHTIDSMPFPGFKENPDFYEPEAPLTPNDVANMVKGAHSLAAILDRAAVIAADNVSNSPDIDPMDAYIDAIMLANLERKKK